MMNLMNQRKQYLLVYCSVHEANRLPLLVRVRIVTSSYVTESMLKNIIKDDINYSEVTTNEHVCKFPIK